MRISNLLVPACLICFFCMSCSDSDDESIKNGYFKLSLNSIVEETITNINVEGVDIKNIDINEYHIQINNKYGEEMEAFSFYNEMPDSIMMETGDYKVIATYNSDLVPSFEIPYYEGRSNFTIKDDSVKHRKMNVDFASVMVQVEYTDYVKENFEAYSTKITCLQKGLLFEQNEQRTGHFPIDTLFVEVSLTRDGQKVIHLDTVTEALPKEIHNLLVTGNPQGDGSFDINVDDTVEESNTTVKF